jgi:hypothetical protein
MKKMALTLLFATVAGALTFGAAASLPVSSQNLGSGGVGVVSCDTDGVQVAYDLIPTEPQLVNGVTVEGIDAACVGQTLSYVISDTASATLVSGSGTVSGPSQSFALSTDLIAEEIGEVGVTIAG